MLEKEILDKNFPESAKMRIADGEEQAFRELFNCFAEKLIQFAFALVKTRDAATEIVDEVFVKIWKRRSDVPRIQNMRVYLYTATKNTALNYLSRKANEQITEPFDFINIELKDEECPEQLMITSEIFRKIKAAVDELPPRCKMIFKLVREDGMRYNEVAEILSISPNTVDAQMVIAVKKISEKVRGQFESFPRLATKKI